MYLPLDALLNLAKAIFYFASRFKDKRERAKRAELQEMFIDKEKESAKEKIMGQVHHKIADIMKMDTER